MTPGDFKLWQQCLDAYLPLTNYIWQADSDILHESLLRDIYPPNLQPHIPDNEYNITVPPQAQ